MYLNKRIYIGNKFREPEQRVKTIVPENQDKVTFPTGQIQDERIMYIIEEVGYWRKANQIHQWFVNHVQGGKDDCRGYYINKEQLEELLSTVGKILQNHSLAPELLPVQQGFSFESDEYDESYFGHLRDTQEILKRAMKEGGEYYYQSSW